MKRLSVILLVLVLVSSSFAEITGWWGQVSFRQRYEKAEEFTDYTIAGEPGPLKFTDTNTKTRVGYQFGFKMDLTDYLFAGVTFRSGVGSVMWQDINNVKDLAPGLQEAYLDWKTPYVKLQLGKIPQQGNAMWDLYACANMTDWRLYDPRDGIFNDRMAALNGGKLSVPVEFGDFAIAPRAIYHADYVGGAKREYDNSEQVDENDLDWQTWFVGLNAQYNYLEVDFDYGFPERLGDKRKQSGKDSVYVDESIWGVNFKAQLPEQFYHALLQVGYGSNDRDSVFAATFFDVLVAAEYSGFRLSTRYQHGVHESQFGNYIGSKKILNAWHFYLNKTIWDLDLQPRVIFFRNDYEHFGRTDKQSTSMRAELTATIKF